MKTHYQALGINEDADDEVIVAAYKALAKKYHPDTYAGDKKFAEERMKEINIAYGILSDKDKRKKYDEEIKSNNKSNEFDYEDSFDDSDASEGVLKEDWSILSEVYPEAEFCKEYLYRISPTLCFSFQIFILTTKSGDKLKSVASDMETAYLEKYFGENEDIKSIAKSSLIEKNREIAKNINKKVSLLGKKASHRILDAIKARYQKEIKNFHPDSRLNIDKYIQKRKMEDWEMAQREEKKAEDKKKRARQRAEEELIRSRRRAEEELIRARREKETKEKEKRKAEILAEMSAERNARRKEANKTQEDMERIRKAADELRKLREKTEKS